MCLILVCGVSLCRVIGIGPWCGYGSWSGIGIRLCIGMAIGNWFSLTVCVWMCLWSCFVSLYCVSSCLVGRVFVVLCFAGPAFVLCCLHNTCCYVLAGFTLFILIWCVLFGCV